MIGGVEMPGAVTLGVRMCSITDNKNGGDGERVGRALWFYRQRLYSLFHVSE